MKALVYRRYGESEVLHLDELEVPTPGPGEVRLRVQAVGVDRGIWHVMAGLPKAARLAFGLRAPKDPLLGQDVAGTVDAVGEGVTTHAVGDTVFGWGRGVLAEFTISRADRVTAIPANLTLEQAAALPTSAVTALQGLRVADLQAGQHVLVTGAAGGVGSYVVQLAHNAGAHVTAVCGPTKLDFVRELGAGEAIDYHSELTGTYDLVFDLGGARSLKELRALTTPIGTIVIAGGEGGGAFLGAAARTIQAGIQGPFTKQKLIGFLARQDGADLLELARLAASGSLVPHVDTVYPLWDAAAAIDHLQRGGVSGKLVLSA